VALITAIAPSHIEHLGSMEAIADAKAEVYESLEPGGTAIIPNDTPYRDRILKAARRHAAQIVTFGSGDADVCATHAVRAANGGSLVSARLLESDLTYTLGQPGEHWVSNSLAVLAAVEAVGADLAAAGLALGDLGGLKGRGERHQVEIEGGQFLLIDESYNANPVSMAATLKSLAAEQIEGRRLAVLGTMRELGSHSDEAHAGLAEPILAAGVSPVILVGEETRPLEQALGGRIEVLRADGPDKAADLLLRTARAGDAVLVKASNGVGLARLVERVAGGAAPCFT
jgi:UDP-N-acetylmuramoyl-tripeptide--D-alanyl-D-alanine ligase